VRFLICAAALFFISGVVCADPPAAGPPAKPASLADALKALPTQSLPQDTLILTVGAEVIRPSRLLLQAPVPNTNIDAYGNVLPPPPDTSTVNGILTIYNRTWQTFGKVAAVAPTKMTVLNVDPQALSQIDPIGLSRGDAMKILLGSLSNTQWQELSSGGLGINELNDTQSALFRAAVRTPMKIVPSTDFWNPPFGQPGFDYKQYQQNYESQVQTLTQDMLSGARLEAHLATMYLLPVTNNGNTQEWMDEAGNPGMPGVYQISSIDNDDSNSNPLSSLVRADLPNTLKPGSLNWNIRPLGATVALDGVKTVDDLVNRIARATGLELYCDPHYASRSVLVMDTTGRPQRARDLLQALCVCLCGAWRQVGPAYVLTDDIQGVAARRALLKEMTNAWTHNLSTQSSAANDNMVDKNWFKSLHFLPGDPNALSADQMKAMEDKAAGPQNGSDWLDMNFSQIPASAQAILKAQVGQYGSNNSNSDFAKVAAALGPDYKMNADLQVRVFLDVASIGLVALDQGSYYNDISLHKQNSGRIDPAPSPAGKTSGPVTFSGTVGALCAPRDATEARAVVDKMAAMGLHLLYCDAFANGKAYVPNSAIPTDAAQASVLPAAIEEGKAKGVSVVAVIDAFAWGSGDPKTRLNPLPPGFAEDETITLESASDALRERAADQNSAPYMATPVVVQWVSPADPRVQGTLAQIVGAVARIPGLAGLAFEDTAPPSYLSKPNFYDQQSLPLGYGPEARLAFLRAHHADPIDFGDEDNNLSVWVGSGIGSSFVQLDIPSFDQYGQFTSLQPAWDTTRKQADVSAMVRLYGTARSANPGLPLFLRSSGFDSSFLPWSKPDQVADVANSNGFDPSHAAPGTQFVMPWAMVRNNASILSFVFPYLTNLFSKEKTPPVLIFDLASDPSPDGPVRDLEVISEHVSFTKTSAKPVNGSPHP
jgi:hypothetical protein